MQTENPKHNRLLTRLSRIVLLTTVAAVLASFISCTDSGGTNSSEPTSIQATQATRTAPSATLSVVGGRSRRTGIISVDRIIDLIESRSVDGLLQLVQYRKMACSARTVDQRAPECAVNEPIGTLVDSLPAASCEGYFARDARPLLELVVRNELYAVARMPQLPGLDPVFPIGQYRVVVASNLAASPTGWAVLIEGDRIVGLWSSCGHPRELLRIGNDNPDLLLGPFE